MNYIIWLIISGICFAFGEFFSKKFALQPNILNFVLVCIPYFIGILTWLPAIMQKNELSTVGAIWSVFSLMATVLIGVIVFAEELTRAKVIGILLGLVSVALLS